MLVYNLEVADYHTYYVADIGVLVHNTCNAGGDIAEGAADKIDEAAGTLDDVEWDGALKDAFDAADNYNLSDDVLNSHIIDRHGSQSTYTNKSLFADDFNIAQGIDDVLTGNSSSVTPNTNGRSGYIFKQTFDDVIGYNSNGNPVSTLKVVINEVGEVITAFPVK